MDKETLSNYGWIVICVLVLAVMIALATPFGTFISNAVQSTTKGLFSTSQNALNSAGVPGLTIEDQEFDVPNAEKEQAKEPYAIFCGYEDDNGTFIEEKVKLTWEELKDPANARKYCYSETGITETSISLDICNYLEEIVIPEGITTIPGCAFFNAYSLKKVTLPSTLTTIESFAFMSASLSSLHIPANVTNIGDGAFDATSIGKITVDAKNQNYCVVNGALYTKDMTKIIKFQSDAMDKFVMPDSVTEIATVAFECAGVSELVLSNNLTTIPSAAFHMSEIKKIKITSSVTNIEGYAFVTCQKLTDIIFEGDISDWNAIPKGADWNMNCGEITITCTDGTITIPAWS